MPEAVKPYPTELADHAEAVLGEAVASRELGGSDGVVDGAALIADAILAHANAVERLAAALNENGEADAGTEQ